MEELTPCRITKPQFKIQMPFRCQLYFKMIAFACWLDEADKQLILTNSTDSTGSRRVVLVRIHSSLDMFLNIRDEDPVLFLTGSGSYLSQQIYKIKTRLNKLNLKMMFIKSNLGQIRIRFFSQLRRIRGKTLRILAPVKIRDEDPVLAKNQIRGSVPQTQGYF